MKFQEEESKEQESSSDDDGELVSETEVSLDQDDIKIKQDQ